MDVKNLIGVLDSEITVYRNLLDTIHSEYEFLVQKDYDAIGRHIELKKDFYSVIIESEKKRQHLIKELSVDNVSELLANLEDEALKEKLRIRRDTLKVLITRISEANERNRIFIEHSRQVFESVVNNIKELVLTNTKPVYGNNARIGNKTSVKNPVLLDKEV
jgi:flagellar biosynthesis/type III secretory pathway chaperone